MNLLSYIKSLAHHFGKNQIQKSCEITIDSLKTHTIPAYVSASEFFKTFKIKSKEAQGYVADFKRIAGLRNSQSIVDAILEGLNKGVVALEFVSNKSDALYSEHESNASLTYKKATYLQLVSSITFANDFSRKFLNVLYILETQQADESVALENNITPAEMQYVQGNFINFANVISTLNQDIAKIDEKIEAMPDAVVTESSLKAFEATVGQSKLDPLGMSNFTLPFNVSVKWNPFYMFAMFVADFQAASYKAAKEELQLLQLRKINLEQINAKKPDARIQQEIEYLSGRVSKLNYEVQQTEKRYA